MSGFHSNRAGIGRVDCSVIMSQFSPYQPSNLLSSNYLTPNKSRGSFVPAKYETSSRYRSKVRFNAPTIRVFKAGDLSIAADDINTILADLKQHSSTEIENLPTTAREKFDRLVTYVHALYDTDDYKAFYNRVRDEYGELKSVYPGTVGAYMAGCMVTNSFSDSIQGCAISCAQSIPRPKSDRTFRHCENPVIKADYDGYRYSFTVYREGSTAENQKDAYLYINSTDEKNYPGFSQVEKKILSELGIEQIKLIGFNSDGRNYVELASDLVPVTQLKSRNRHYSQHLAPVHSYEKSRPKPNSSGSNSWWIIVVIVVILIIVFLLWIFYRNRYRNAAMYYKMSQEGGYLAQSPTQRGPFG